VKISKSIRSAFDEQSDLHRLLEKKVKATLEPVVQDTWHYEGRVKSVESYALKIETGRFDPDDLEDFFGCTLVVPTMNVTDDAEALVQSLFDVLSRKPETSKMAMAGALDFRFDHTRLYARIKVPLGLDPGPIHTIRFEIQIKTYLQHAWSIATHDLTYKTSELSWGKERVAAQVKATLEAAEVSIVEAEQLSKSGNKLLTREDHATTQLAMIAGTLQRNFTSVLLPADVKRLAQTIKVSLDACAIDLAQFGKILDAGKRAHGGSHPADFSPFGLLVLYLVEQQPGKLRRALRRKNGPMIYIPKEITLPVSFNGIPLPSARLLA